MSLKKHSFWVNLQSSRNCSPTPDLVFFSIILPRVFYSGGVLLFTDTGVIAPMPLRRPCVQRPTGAQATSPVGSTFGQFGPKVLEVFDAYEGFTRLARDSNYLEFLI